MGSITRAIIVYVVLMLIFRIAGKRTLNEMTTFDFVLLLIVSEAVQQAMIDNDNSMTNAFFLVFALIGMDIMLSLAKQRFPQLGRVIDGSPIVIVQNGKPIQKRMKAERIDDEDVLAAAREMHGLERMEQIKYAVLEENGTISIIPAKRENK
jgi:uncharacterized membrane protein YcaP (DUF421 family)